MYTRSALGRFQWQMVVALEHVLGYSRMNMLSLEFKQFMATGSGSHIHSSSSVVVYVVILCRVC